jgi:hypothetical protein
MVINKIISHFFRPTISLAILIVISAMLVGATWYTATHDLLNKRDAARGVAPLGTEVSTDMMSLKIESVREDPIGALPFVPREGYTFIIPTFSITNMTDRQRDLIPTLTLYIKDRDGNIYNMAIAPLHTEQFGGPILPHDTVRQEMAFEVKKNTKDLVFYFETGGKLMAERLTKDPSIFR